MADQLVNYESTYIVRPDLDAATYAEILKKFNDLLATGGAEVINQEVWGLKKLAYPIEKQNSGYYVFTEFKAPGALIAKLEQEYIYDERVIRFLTVSLDKHATAWNDKRRARQKGAAANA